jgi:lipoprotein-releasing system ATP-binding protein
MIHTTGITKNFGSLQVLKGIDLHIKKGEFVSIIGASGAGKTTLLQIIGSLDKPDAGALVVDGVALNGLSDKALAAFRNKHIGFVFQFHQLLPEFTALENVCIPAFIAGSSTSDAEKKAKDLLAKLGLENRISHKPNELSGGEKQRVAVARALINQPSLILADEPSGSLDSANKKELHSLLRRLCNEYGLTILVVTHDKDLADVSDRVIEMRDGSIVDATTK